jgi:ribosomal protein L29
MIEKTPRTRGMTEKEHRARIDRRTINRVRTFLRAHQPIRAAAQ